VWTLFVGIALLLLSLCQAKKTAAVLTRACLAVQHAHHYFTLALKICDEVRGTAGGRAFIGAIGGGDGINEMTKKIQYGSMSLLFTATNRNVGLNNHDRLGKNGDQSPGMPG